MVQYTIWRLLIFFGFLVALLWTPLETIWAVILAALLSMVTSFFLLTRQREQMARRIEARVEEGRERRAERLASQRTDEDDEDAEVERR